MQHSLTIYVKINLFSSIYVNNVNYVLQILNDILHIVIRGDSLLFYINNVPITIEQQP